MASNITGITLAGLLTSGKRAAIDSAETAASWASITAPYLTDTNAWYIAQPLGVTGASTTVQYVTVDQRGAFCNIGATQVMQASPAAFMGEQGEYDEVHASVPKNIGGVTITMTQFPNMYVALLRQQFEQQGIVFDTSMGAPPTMVDLRGQIKGGWAMWEDMDKDTWELTQRMPRAPAPKVLGMDAGEPDIEAVFESEMTDALTRLMGALQARDEHGTA